MSHYLLLLLLIAGGVASVIFGLQLEVVLVVRNLGCHRLRVGFDLHGPIL